MPPRPDTKYAFEVRDNYSGVTCIVGPCTVTERNELLNLWAPGDLNDGSPFDDRWGYAPVLK